MDRETDGYKPVAPFRSIGNEAEDAKRRTVAYGASSTGFRGDLPDGQAFAAYIAGALNAYAIDRPTPVVDREAVRRVVTAAFRASNNTGPDADQRLQAFVDDILALATTRDEVIEGLIAGADAFRKALPVQHEKPTHGSCSYNWWSDFVDWLRSHKGSAS